MKRKHKIYSRPKRPFDKARIDEEVGIKEKYGLKNKREIWKADAKIRVIRQKAKTLIKASEEEKEALFKQLQKIGLNVHSIADVLGLDKTDYLERRLQTIVKNKGLVPTIKSARQMITHKKILVDGKIINIPSYIVPVKLENKITVKKTIKKEKQSKEIKEKISEKEDKE
jgi:small subunit ribosomal protein S4